MSTAAHDVPEDEWLLTVPEAVEALRISRSHFFKLKRRGVIETVKLGSRTVVPRREITRLIDEALSAPQTRTAPDARRNGRRSEPGATPRH